MRVFSSCCLRGFLLVRNVGGIQARSFRAADERPRGIPAAKARSQRTLVLKGNSELVQIVNAKTGKWTICPAELTPGRNNRG
jgi:hypothetical protein